MEGHRDVLENPFPVIVGAFRSRLLAVADTGLSPNEPLNRLDVETLRASLERFDNSFVLLIQDALAEPQG